MPKNRFLKLAFLKRDFGFSIMEIMVVAGLLGVVAMFGTQMVSAQTKDQRRLTQKAESIDLRNNLIQAISVVDNCKSVFDGTSFDANDPNATINLPNGVSLAKNTSPFIFPGSTVPGTQTNLRVSQIWVQEIKSIGTNQFKGYLTVSFDQASLIGSLAPIKYLILLFSNDASNIKTIASCGGTSSSPIDTCNQTVGYHWDSGSNACVQNNTPQTSQCNNLSIPNGGDGTCGQENVTDPGQCVGTFQQGSAGYYTCTADGWQCLGTRPSSCIPPPATVTQTQTQTATAPATATDTSGTYTGPGSDDGGDDGGDGGDGGN